MAVTEFDGKIVDSFPGFVVRKDLSKLVKGNALVPVYVLEYLLGQYCSTDDEQAIQSGVERVQQILRDHYVVQNQAGLIRSRIKEHGTHRVIDRVVVELNDKLDQYEATFMNLGLKDVPIDDKYVKSHPKLLVGGVWSIIDIAYEHHDDSRVGPWSVESLKPIQVSSFSFEPYLAGRSRFDLEEWKSLLVQSMGFDPSFFGEREKLLLISRLIPFCENNYNLIELGPKGTGKSHIYSEFSPHGILISGGEVTLAKLFVNNSNGRLGLVGYWDTVAFDEFAGQKKRSDKSLVDVMKNYLANKSFSRGMDTQGAAASFAFVGNTRRSVPYMLKHSDLFEELPAAYHDSAFIDRLHYYLPGWEVSVLRNELFTDGFGFIVDYFAEMLKHLRNADYSEDYRRYFELNRGLSTRDRTAVEKTTSGLLKILFPAHDASKEQVEQIFRFAIEGRKRVYEQLIKIDNTFERRKFSYSDLETGETKTVVTLEERNYPQLVRADQDAGQPEPQSPESAAPTNAQPKPAATIPIDQSIEPGSQRLVSENETGISYRSLFAECLTGARKVEIVDPYIRNFHQAKNLFEFLEMLMSLQEIGDEVSVSLVTGSAGDFDGDQEGLLDQIRDGFTGTSVAFDYTISDDPSLHARHITTDTGWKISLDRGLDVFQPFNRKDAFTLQNTVQEARRCRAFEVTYLKR